MCEAKKHSKCAGHMNRTSEGRRSNGMEQAKIITIILALQ